MNKPTKRVMSLDQLVSRTEDNVREDDNYDLPAMQQQVVVAGRIHTSLIVEKVDEGGKPEYRVLQGHRRTRAGQELIRKPELISNILLTIADNEKEPAKREQIKKDIVALTETVVENLKRVEVMVYEGLSAEERLVLTLDHGSMKPISKTEVVNTVWKMDRQFFSEGDIIRVAYFSLARYTGNERKLTDIPKEPKERESFLRKWLHGTVGNYILAAHKMGEYIRQQFLLSHRADDGLLKESEKVELRCSRDRITQLSAAKNEERAIWDPDKGSPKFNELVQRFKNEDAGVIEKSTKSRPSIKELNDKADVFKTGAIRKALLIAAGETGEKVLGLVEDDDRIYRDEQILKLLSTMWEKLPKEVNGFNVQEFATRILHDSPAKFGEYVSTVCQSK